jgi:hypothetical protein
LPEKKPLGGVVKTLVQIQGLLAFMASNNAPENLVATFRAKVSSLFILNPLLGPHLSPMGNGP